MKITLTEALLRRKELSGKVQVLSTFKKSDLFELKVQRVKAHEGIDEVTAQVPKMTASQVTAELDFAARQLRLIDAVIQKTNWTTEITVDDSVMSDFVAAETKA
jgi:hypothetical protein